ncbi:glycoside hydrolase family 3 C-terminal domain-containing protein [Actinomadura sp. WAC 06369]|uniref:glycoside hydrolase family 3 C-terminal domain-containing protein n=1 Tax=Actinomadura sp. WAC 06369 TaxID=2203193 RepID=UPI003FA39FC9
MDGPRGPFPAASFTLAHREPTAPADEPMERAVAAAAAADVAVVVVGTSAEVESEGFDRTSLRLPGRQDELVARVPGAYRLDTGRSLDDLRLSTPLAF